MNLIEAIKSGKRFRRKSWTTGNWYVPNGGRVNLPYSAIIADDWEIESQPATITREQFDAAWTKNVSSKYPYSLVVRDALAKELGL